LYVSTFGVGGKVLNVKRRKLRRGHPKVLFVANFYPPYRMPLFRELAASKEIDFEFATGDRIDVRNLPSADIGEIGGHVLRTRFIGSRLPFGPFYWQMGAIRLLARERPHMAIFTGDWRVLSTWVALLIGKLLGIPIGLHTMGWRGLESGLERGLKRVYYGLAKVLFLYGEQGLEIARREGLARRRQLVAVHNSASAWQDVVVGDAFDKGVGAAALASLGLAPGRPTLICVSRLEPQRELDLLVRLATKRARAGAPVNLLLVGEGTQRLALSRMCSSAGISATFAGAVFDHDRLRALYGAADLCVIPGAAGLAVIQSMAHGVPVVTNDDSRIQGPETEAIKDGVTGALFGRGDIESLDAAISRALAIPSAREACTSMVLKRYTAEAQAAAFTRGVLVALGR
jgi:glycosyltransferase involved in cell wall biosynthesis